ncbi:MAG TPA: hypothetical protein VIN77_03420 [Aurantimonas sp.]|uniref:DUF3035 domain-containing protein n=1 Tax=Aurantimonas marianensis TaxID=2920428 RepID=A0A9X2KEJ7_9HYPH|nr:hypothetical protein [Aurantimonas marianensis]MCP3054340.1 hypothetical protein [Aurantimonas marianensis]
MTKTVRLASHAMAIGAVTLVLSGCLGPTYGTGKSQGETLFDDLNNMVSLGGGSEKGAEIAYAPRPDLVKPENTSILPPPQAARNTTGDPNWPESPEQRSARLQAAAYQGDGPLPADIATARKEGVTQAYLDRTTRSGHKFDSNRRDTILSPEELRGRGELVRQRLREGQQGSPTQRKYLSEPPVAYRKPAATAPVGDPGEDESVKERRIRGSNGGLGSKIRDLLPF